ncbi:MAG: hypothetical protein HUK26_04075 [Duodenibacillus sp.]|nr:hypothetical protein [Duodenibacillus sp.]
MAKIDIQKQAAAIDRLRDELGRLNKRFEEVRKAGGVSDADLEGALKEDTPASLAQAMQEARARAEQDGRAAVAALRSETEESTAAAGGVRRARRGAMSI